MKCQHILVKIIEEEEKHSSWDWRNVDGKNFVSPVVDQGSTSCSSCVSFGVTATVETAARIKANIPINQQNNIDISKLSEAWLYFCNVDSCVKGWNIPGALEYTEKTGIPPESCCEYDLDKCCKIKPKQQDGLYTNYDSSYQSYEDCTTCCEPHCESCKKEKKTIVKGHLKIRGIKELKSWIVNQGPITASIYVPIKQFLNYSARDGIFACPNSPYTGLSHAISCVGFDDKKEAWLCKNSFGKDWGHDGYMWLKYDSCMIGNTGFGIKKFKQITCSCPDGANSCVQGNGICENNIFTIRK